MTTENTEVVEVVEDGKVIGNKLPPEDIKTKPPVEPTAEEKAAKEKTDAEAAAKAKTDAEAAAAKKVEDASAAGKTEWAKIDNPVYNSVVEMLADGGVTPLEGSAIFDKAVASGNLEDIDWATLEKKVKPGQFTLIKAGVEKYYADAYAPIQATVAKGYEIVGGEENWTKVKDWAQKAEKSGALPASTIKEIREGIAANGWIAEKAVERLKGLYEADPKNKGLGVAKITLGDNKPAATGDALSAAEYQKLNRELHAGLREPDQRKVDELRARRKAGMAQGL